MSDFVLPLRASIAAACLALAVGFGAACQPASNLCNETRTTLAVDGGEARCVVAEDCPRPEDLVVCTTEGAAVEPNCVACEDTRCVRYTAEPCR